MYNWRRTTTLMKVKKKEKENGEYKRRINIRKKEKDKREV